MSVADDFPKHKEESDTEWLWRLLGDERYLQSQADRAANELWDAGLSVWRADSRGIYRLHRDGRKEYRN